MKQSLMLTGATFIALAMLGAGGPSDQATLQGTWKGQEISQPTPGTNAATLTIKGNTLTFQGTDTNEWYSATFVLHENKNPKQLIAVITSCPMPPYMGKTANAIYQFEGAALRLSGNEPGEPGMPTAFNSPGARQFLFQPVKP